MIKHFTFVALPLLLPGLLLAQGNYVANTANNTTRGTNNTLVGPNAAPSVTSDRNTIVGYNAGSALTLGKDNSFFGAGAGQNNTIGGYNVFLGKESGYNTTSASYNTFIGMRAGYRNTTGGSNVITGAYAGYNNTEGDDNVFSGNSAGYNNTTGSYNVSSGPFAGYSSTTGDNNVFLGNRAGFTNTTASNNVFIGYQAGYTNTTGTANLFLGSYAGVSSNGSYNLFMGNSSGQQTTSGAGNTFIGNGSGYGNTTGLNNTYIGNGAGFTGNGAGQSNTFIGQNAGVSSGAVVNNATAIGVGAQVSADYAIVLGAPNPLWKVGIGNTAPGNKLEITHGTNGQSGLRFTNLKSTNSATATNATKVLSVNENGDVILVSTNGSTREGVSEFLWQRNGSFLQSTQNDAVIIGEGVSKTPSDYNLFVSKGILTEKVKVAVRNTSDWSDKVFDEGYSLKGLAEVEKYIQDNKHLPGVPSAKEVVEKGVDVAKMDAKLLEKIEELTLYSIGQEKKASKQEAIIQQQQARIDQLELQHKKEIDELKALVKQLLEKK
ncbi:hypothetical protein IC229_26235 [Spirosoma sp. BT702]|uniref:TMF family protein n=1 Tax=Spirosoma profusum TaxID=2771354 RepID=A0A926Y1E4_9BACT|nr:hypothetical protein [Spirosoma profusum]MBD2704170.1 hypothetical protein [Spirosoma profusum]